MTYFGARYYDPRVSGWVSTDPAFDKYLPTQRQLSFPDNDFNLSMLPGMGGIYNSKNLTGYSYGQSSPLNFKDPDGRLDYPVNMNLFRVTSPVGMRANPTNPAAGAEHHTGTDIRMGEGTSVLSVGAGQVSAVGETKPGTGLGKYIIVTHYDKINGKYVSTLYGHNSAIKVKTGEKVREGQVITASGNTGRSSGPHLHFEIRSSIEKPKSYADFIKGDIMEPRDLQNFGKFEWFHPRSGDSIIRERPSDILNRIINQKGEFQKQE